METLNIKNSQILHVRLSLRSVSILKDIASKQGDRSTSSLIREAIDEFLKDYAQ